jgi:putative membrane protein
VAFLLAAGLGRATLDLSPAAPLAVDGGGVLTPLFGGLFGAPVLLDALRGGGVPPQEEPDLRLSRAHTGGTALAGTAAGAFVGYLPGVSAGVAATLALPIAPERGPRAFVVASSGANTAVAVFALFALAELGVPRTGVAVGLRAVGADVAGRLALFVAVVVAAAAAGVALVVTVGDAYLLVVGRLPQAPLVVGVCGLLVALSALFAGTVGVAILVAATAVGLVPARVGCRRVHLMGVLLGPILLRGVPPAAVARAGAWLPG